MHRATPVPKMSCRLTGQRYLTVDVYPHETNFPSKRPWNHVCHPNLNRLVCLEERALVMRFGQRYQAALGRN